MSEHEWTQIKVSNHGLHGVSRIRNPGVKIITTLILTRAHGSDPKAAQQRRTPIALRAKTFVFIRVHPWLKGKLQHLDRGRNFDVLVAHDEIQRSGGTGMSWSYLLSFDRRWRCHPFARRTFVFLVVHIQRANDKKLSGGTCDLI